MRPKIKSIFVNGPDGNLHLDSAATAAIDHGAAVPAGICTDDFDGDHRPAGSARDIGADEFDSDGIGGGGDGGDDSGDGSDGNDGSGDSNSDGSNDGNGGGGSGCFLSTLGR